MIPWAVTWVGLSWLVLLVLTGLTLVCGHLHPIYAALHLAIAWLLAECDKDNWATYLSSFSRLLGRVAKERMPIRPLKLHAQDDHKVILSHFAD